MERLYELASKVPADTPVRERIEAKAYEEAERFVKEEPHAPPWRVIVAKLFLLLVVLLTELCVLLELRGQVLANLLTSFKAAVDRSAGFEAMVARGNCGVCRDLHRRWSLEVRLGAGETLEIRPHPMQ